MKYEIDIEGLPEGWKPVAYRKPIFGESYFYNDDIQNGKTGSGQFLIVEKIQPRRIVLESRADSRKAVFGDWIYNDGFIEQWRSQKESQATYRIWREVKETREDPKLSLTKKDMMDLIEHIKLGGQLNPKIAEFIKENS